MLRGPRGFDDVGGMLGVLKWAHENSLYAGRYTFDEAAARRVVCQAIQRHGFRSAAGSWVQLAEKDGATVGMIVGVLNPVYGCAVEIGASDLWWIATNDCSARDRVGLMLSLVDWAKAHPKVAEITSAPNDVMGGAERAARILEHLGFERCGGLYRMEVMK